MIWSEQMDDPTVLSPAVPLEALGAICLSSLLGGSRPQGNIPEGCSDGVGWKDAKGNDWLFGGYNYGSSNSHFNDLFWPLNSRRVANGTWAED
jgi:hypothetical protein